MVRIIGLVLLCFSVYCTATVLKKPQLQRLNKRGEGLKLDLNLPPPDDTSSQAVEASGTQVLLNDSQSVDPITVKNTAKKRKRGTMVSMEAFMEVFELCNHRIPLLNSHLKSVKKGKR